MIRRTMVICAAFFVLSSTIAIAATPAGPRLAYLEFGKGPFKLELKSAAEDGSAAKKIAGSKQRTGVVLPLTYVTPNWSADGARIAFAGGVEKKGSSQIKPSIYVANADGSGLHKVPGTSEGLAPVFSPDGRTLAFSRTKTKYARSASGKEKLTFLSTAIWTVNLSTKKTKRLTPYTNGLLIEATSFAPDGASLTGVRAKGSTTEIVSVEVGSGAVRTIVVGGTDPVYSPDGSQIAFIKISGSSSDLFTMNADGTSLKQLTSTPGDFELWPSWDPSGRRLAFTQMPSKGNAGPDFFGSGNSIAQINADGSCLKTALSKGKLSFLAASWQPGAGREAGKISC